MPETDTEALSQCLPIIKKCGNLCFWGYLSLDKGHFISGNGLRCGWDVLRFEELDVIVRV